LLRNSEAVDGPSTMLARPR
jgi:8-oxo-dGTP diphosphatase